MSLKLQPGYYEQFFDDHTNDVVDEVFDRQKDQSWEAFRQAHGVPDTKVFESSHHPIEVFDMIPEAGFDRTLVYHGAMGDSLDPNIVAHLANVSITLNRAFPEHGTRVISTSNPGRIGNSYGRLTKDQIQRVKQGDFKPTVQSTLNYLAQESIGQKIEFGYSYGADKAVAAAANSERYDQQATHVIAMEPATIKPWSTLELAQSFLESGAQLDAYAAATDSQAYMEARKLAGGLPTYIGGLLRASNLAIMQAIKYGFFEERVDRLMRNQRELPVYVGWGQRSELADNKLMWGAMHRLTNWHGDRLHFDSYPDLHHAHADDLRVHTATIINAFKKLDIGGQKSAA